MYSPTVLEDRIINWVMFPYEESRKDSVLLPRFWWFLAFLGLESRFTLTSAPLVTRLPTLCLRALTWRPSLRGSVSGFLLFVCLFWPHRVFLAVHRLSLDAASGGSSLVAARTSHGGGFSYSGPQAVGARQLMGL